ncbi:hypothetical protein L1987_31245 [Smallanthus sonchifolius]|uniref:Uncharacterized protein n=1 Tax=Smallanthus sonchifolius TaxID=185202 RepID=A0ACB9I6J9_9ASTR|nr:hypothetical protein L1987_31245 [Smallanthus sonchifolius]
MKEYCNIESWSVLFKFEAEAHDVIRVVQPVTDGDLLAYYDGSRVYNLQTMLLTKLMKFGPECFNIEMGTYVESLGLLDIERATTCGETIFCWTKEDNCKRIRLSQLCFLCLNRIAQYVGSSQWPAITQAVISGGA